MHLGPIVLAVVTWLCLTPVLAVVVGLALRRGAAQPVPAASSRSAAAREVDRAGARRALVGAGR